MLLYYPILTITLYFLPGLVISRLFEGKLKNSPFFQIFLSFLITPFIYTLLAYFRRIDLYSFLIALVLLALLIRLASKSPKLKINFGEVLPENKLSKNLIFLMIVFWLMTVLPRIGLLQGKFPIGDDMHRLGKTVSVAESPAFPLLYNFPTTRMTIYYFVTVGSGLLTKFSDNSIKANYAWFIHVSLWSLVILYFLAISARNIFKTIRAQTIFFLSLTFFSGYEFYIALLTGVNPLIPGHWTDLEWWTDWFTKIFNIHFQISSPYTLFFWVPQHLFAGILTLLVFFILRSNQRRNISPQILLGLIFATIFGYSLFVFLTVGLAFVLFELITSLKNGRGLSTLIKDNWQAATVFLVLSFDLINLYLTSEKTSWFEFRLNNYWFFDNRLFFNKIINLILTVPSLFLVELGGLAVILFYTIQRLRRGEKEVTNYFWHFCLLLPFSAMFFLRAADDNNIALRSTIPSLVALAVFAGRFVEEEKKYWKLALFYLVLIVSLPTTFIFFFQRLTEQYSFGAQNLKPIYALIDQKTPSRSIIFTDEKDQWANIPTLAHRFTFKPIKEFGIADLEYSAKSDLSKYENFGSTNVEEIKKFTEKIREEKSHLRNYDFYFLTQKELKQPKFLESGIYKLYPL